MSALQEAFKYSEAKLANRIGISRGEVKILRDDHLIEDRDWKKFAGGVALNNRGLKGIWCALRSRPATFDLSQCLIGASKKNGSVGELSGASANGEPIRLGWASMPIPIPMTVIRVTENPYMLLTKDAHGALCSVRVGSNANFVVGMEINAAEDRVNAGFYRLLGPLPRLRGRWI